ncbi:MAG: hypothetical protein MUF16_02250, partial [Burkholderiaceae bacterium]|jgi:hypothetical protein|nr:hypothetical protein [Burkholderiaceae bacterium]
MTNTREFKDTMPVQHEPMDFTPIWYQRRAVVAACRGKDCASGQECPTPDACRLPAEEDSDFGALDGIVRSWAYMAAAWIVVFAAVAVIWWLA